MKPTSWADISRYRSEMMGAAMLFIILFHVALSPSDPFFGLRRCGNVGVDMFLFLSGVGLWYSWTKQPSAIHFFKRRYIRVYPTWLAVACLFYIPRFLSHPATPESTIDLAGDIILNWDFWLNDELTFWYVPAIMMLYTFAPAYMRLIEKHPGCRWMPVLMIVWCVAVQWVGPIHGAVGHIEIFWSRVPIFFIGINLGWAVKERRTIDGVTTWLSMLVFASTAALCIYLEQQQHGRFPLFIERMVYIPMSITLILLLAKVFNHSPKWLLRGLAFIGTLSLEIYLLHVQFVLLKVERLDLHYWPTFAITLACSLPLAWMLHKGVSYITDTIQKQRK